MTIGDIITLHYNELKNYVISDKVISHSKTEEDILQDILITALNKYQDEDITENEGLDYLKRNLYYAKVYQYSKKKTDILTFTDNLEDYEK